MPKNCSIQIALLQERRQATSNACPRHRSRSLAEGMACSAFISLFKIGHELNHTLHAFTSEQRGTFAMEPSIQRL